MSSKRPIFKDGDYMFEYPMWEDCQWRRIPCNKVDCPLCHKSLKREQKHKLDNRDPNDVETVVDDVAESLGEAMMMLQQAAEEERGIDLDDTEEPANWKEREAIHDYPLNKKVRDWMKKVHDFIQITHITGPKWSDTESWKDIRWYHTILPVKTNRQLTNRWQMDNINDDGCDHQYTHWVLEEVIEILEKAFYELLNSDSVSYEEKTSLHRLSDELQSLEKDILSI